MTTSNHMPPNLGQILRDFDPAPEIIRVKCKGCRHVEEHRWPHSLTNHQITQRLTGLGWHIKDENGAEAHCPNCKEGS